MITLLATVLGAVLLTSLGSHPPSASAAEPDDPDVAVTISQLSPSHLTSGSRVRVSGVVRNRNDHPWTKAQAYLVIPAVPFTTRAQVDEASDNPNAYTGVRLVEVGTFDEVGDIGAGQSRPFQLSVPFEKLGISGDEGIYPIGVQILATDVDGSRSGEAIAQTTTFVPLISSDEPVVPTSVVWPFIMPDHRGADGDYAAPAELMKSISAGGQLRNLLDLAASIPGAASTALVDPALLVGVDDLAKQRHLPDKITFTDVQVTEAERFLADLLTFVRGHSPWILDFDRPDSLALSINADLRAPLQEAIDTATDSVLTAFQLSGRRVSWPTREGVTRSLLSDLRGSGDSPVIVSSIAVPDWEPRLGSLVKYDSAAGPVPLLVNLMQKVGTAEGTVVGLRQKVLTEAALGVLERAIDPESRADAFVMADPQWNPGNGWAAGQFSGAFAAPFTRGVGLDTVMTRALATYDGDVPTTADADPLSRRQLATVAEAAGRASTLSSVISESAEADVALARRIAGALAVRWRSDRATGVAVAAALVRQTGAELEKISIEAPPSVTLSSSKGGFPLTIRNDSTADVKIGVDLDSSNPALTVPAVEAVTVGAGERRTITVTVDLGRQRTAYLTAHLATTTGETVGAATTFKVRSSSIGVVLWVAMGLGAAFVLLTLVRRFHRHRKALTSTALPGDDD